MARDFDDAGSHVLDSGGTPNIVNGATSISLYARVWLDDTTTEHKVMSQWGSIDADRTFLLSVNTSGQTVIGVKGAGIAAWNATSGMSTGSWHDILATWTAPSTVTIYQDGSSVGTANIVDTGVASLQNAGVSLRIGADNDGDFMDGKIAECAIWKNVVLNAAQANGLADSYAPSFYRNGQGFYAPLIGRNSPEIDVRGGLSLTVTGATNFAHPRVIYPNSLQIFTTPAVIVTSRRLALMGVGV